VIGLFVFFIVLWDLLFSFGIFSESGAFFIYVPYSKIVGMHIPFFSNCFKKSVYFYPKYR